MNAPDLYPPAVIGPLKRKDGEPVFDEAWQRAIFATPAHRLREGKGVYHLILMDGIVAGLWGPASKGSDHYIRLPPVPDLGLKTPGTDPNELPSSLPPPLW